MAQKTRNSSIELLRIICIFGIIFMHTIAYGGNELLPLNRYLLIFFNCFTNLGVTCFMLISGYFGISFQPQKLIKLELMVWFYTALHLVIKAALGVSIGKIDLLSAVFPILSNQYWYLTAYFIIAVLSGFLNEAAQKLNREKFLQLLAVLLFVLTVVPTVLHFDMLGSEGKNIVQMITIYFIGRYIRLYDKRTYEPKKLLAVLFGNVFITFVLEMCVYVTVGRYSMFYRDCSIFTVISAILLFLLFRSFSFVCPIVNKTAGGVLAVYVFSFGFQRLVYLLLPLEEYAFSPLFFPLVLIFALCVTAGCLFIDFVRRTLFGTMEEKLSMKLAEKLHKIICRGNIVLKTARRVFLNYVEK